MSLNRFFNSLLKSGILNKMLLTALIICSGYMHSFAQIFPVSVTTNLRAPYSLNLSDYASPAYDRMQVNLNMTDLSKVNYPVLLRLVIRGQGVTLITQPGQEIGPVYLTGGSPVILTGSEVNQLFNPEKLQFSGITYQQYKQNSALPEGIYQFHFEVVDYALGVTLSNINAGFSTAWLVLNDPPLINAPANNATIVPMPQQNIFFQWTPRHTGSPNSAFTTVYDVQLVEIYPADRNPNDAMLTSPLIFEKTLYNTSYNYSLIDPYLMPNKWYAFRVKARDVNGLDLFKNQGFSEVYRFYYGEACSVPANLKVDALTETSVVAYWDNQGAYEFTDVEYHAESSKRWNSVTSYLNRVEITNMNPGEKYFFRLRGKCPDNYSEYTEEFIYTPATSTTGGDGGAECSIPAKEEITATATDFKTINVSWNTSKGFDQYTFRFRPLSGRYFTELNSTTSSIVVYDLDQDKIYEGQILYHCASTNQWIPGGYVTFKISSGGVSNTGGGTGDCFPPLDITHTIKADQSITISWPKDNEASAYRVYWRENVLATSWDSVTVSNSTATLTGLKIDREYVYQIRSVCKDGKLSIPSKDGFFNISEGIISARICNAPVLKPYVPVSSEEVKLSWEEDTSHTSYVLEYREQGSKFWMASKSTVPYQLVSHLQLGVTYEYHVYAFCGQKSSDFSVIDTFSTVPDPPKPFICGSTPSIQSITNRTPIASLKAGDKFTAADFEMEVLVLSAPGAPYNGEAMSKIPYLMNSSFRFGMQNVQINDQGQMYDGKIYMKGVNLSVLDPKMAVVIKNMLDQVDAGFTSLEGFLTQVSALQDSINDYISRAEGGNNVGRVVTGNVSATQTLNVKVSNASQISGSGSNGNCQLTVRGDDGSTQTISVQAPATIADNSGTIYAIDLSCNATKVAEKITLTQTPADFNNLSNKASVVYVDYSSKQKFGFSTWNSVYAASPAEWAARYQLLGSSYRVPAKAIEPATIDYVKATISISDATIDKSKVIFVTGKGTKFTSKSLGGNDYEITVVGGPDKDAQELYALYPTGTDQYISFGKLLIAAYKHKKRTLVLVPVNGTNTHEAAIKEKLNKIYNQYCVEWEVITDANFTDMSWDVGNNGLAIEGSGTFSVLTEEMLALNKAYKDARTITPTNIYLFVLPKAETAGVKGDMPRAKQFGYLFTENVSEEDIASTAAHEMGHGLFLLRHIFDGYGMTEGSLSDNLMDYPVGNELAKLQWDVMHDPGIVLGVFERDEDAQAVIVNNITILAPFKNVSTNPELNGTFTFLTPSGKYITLPSTIKAVEFSTLDRSYYIEDGEITQRESNNLMPLGSLNTFTDKDGIVYSYHNSGTTFMGYTKSYDNIEYYNDVYTKILKPTSGICLFMGVKNNSFIAYIGRFESPLIYSDADYNQSASGALVMSPIIIDNILLGDELNNSLEEYLNATKESEYPLLTTTEYTFTLQNGGFHLWELDVSIEEYLKEALTQTSSIKDYLFYFSLISVKSEELLPYVRCEEQSNPLFDFGKKLQLEIKSLVFEEMEWNSARDLAGTQEILRIKTLEQISSESGDLLTKINSLKELADNPISAENAEAIYDFLEDNGYRKCYFYGLGRYYRIRILSNLVLEDGTWTIGSDNLLVDIIETAPPAYKISLLNEFRANNYAWIGSMYEQLAEIGEGYEDEDLEAFLELSDVLNSILVENHASLSIPITTVKMYDLDIDGVSEYEYYPGQEDFYLGGDNEESYVIDDCYKIYYTMYGQTGRVRFSGGKFRFDQNYYFTDVTLSYNDAAQIRNKTTWAQYDASYDPFEPVTVVFVKNYSDIGFNANDRLVVPAYTAALLEMAVYNSNFSKNLRTATNIIQVGAAIATFIPSGGTSATTLVAIVTARMATITTQVGGGVAALDELIQRERAGLSTYADQSAYEAWDQFKAVVDYSQLASGGAYAAAGVYSRMPVMMRRLALARNWKRFNVYVKTYGNNVGNSLRKAWTYVAKGSSAVVITDIAAVVNKIRNSPTLLARWGLASPDEVDELLGILRTNMPNEAESIFRALDELVEGGTSYQNMMQTVRETGKYMQFGDGSKWTLTFLRNSTTSTRFRGKILQFESSEVIPGQTARYIDVKDITNARSPILYEFKSVQTPFTDSYATQMIKDFINPNVSNLSQVKWMYNGSKLSGPLNKAQLVQRLASQPSFGTQRMIDLFSDYAESIGSPAITTPQQLINFMNTNNTWFTETYLVL